MKPNPDTILQDMLQNTAKAAALLKLIAHPHRLMILCLLIESEKNVTELVEAIGINQTAVSNHLAKLRSEGVVEYTRYHRVLQYRITSPEIEAIINTLHDIYCP
ncbi:MAG: metalloregulator ArsR/SmtB family transcription factor [Neisseria sp.]|nr:metalloregulator ArsR/SmtB family transcription factor [Neisseria sp.]